MAVSNAVETAPRFHDGSGCVPVEQITGDQSISVHRKRASAEAPKAIEVTSSKVMIIDDEPSTALIVKKYLKTAGFEQIIVQTDSRLGVESIAKRKPRSGFA